VIHEMELFGPDLRPSLISGIWRRLFSCMFWPDDEQQRTDIARAHSSHVVID
jgi:hypothetical protein